jgi:uncharacterized protein (DUF433 family)
MPELLIFPTRQVARVSEWHGFYTLPQIHRLTGVPLTTLYEWQRRRIISPSVEIVENDALERGYSYADLTIVRMLRALRDSHLDFRSAAIALNHLYHRLGPPSSGWGDALVYFDGKRIYAEKPDSWNITVATQYGQKIADVLFGEYFAALRAGESDASIIVPKQFWGFVQIDPEVMGGEPVVAGTRVPTGLLGSLFEKGKSIKELQLLYRPLTRTQVAKAIEYEKHLDEQEASTRKVASGR